MPDINSQIFREYDIRGIADQDLSEEKMYYLGRALAAYMNERGYGKSAVGRDNRVTSEAYSKELIKGLVESGFEVKDIGLVTSPMSYYAVHHLEMPAVMITASHNPAEYNGVKLTLPGESVYGKGIQRILQYFRAEDFVNGKGSAEEYDIVTPYRAMLNEKISVDRPLKVVLDCGNGTTSVFAEDILKDWGCEVIADFCVSDGTFPNHIADPVKVENAQRLGARVRELGADIGIGFDGDGDRIGVVDHEGNMIYADILMVLFYEEVLKKYPEMPCLIEVKCSQALYEECERLGGKPEFYRTGHSLIKARMKELDAKFAGEMSGHIFFADEYYGYDDCFYATGRLLRIMSETGKSIQELLKDVPRYVSTPEVRVATTDEEKFKIVETLANDFKEEYDVIDVDGARVQFPSGGWGLVRASNTQPAIVVRAEAKDPQALSEIKKVLEAKLMNFDSITEIDWSGSSH